MNLIANVTWQVKKLEEEADKLAPLMREIKERMDERQVLIDEKREALNSVEDEKFADFCEQLGVDNIRQYEERQSKQSQEVENRRLQFETELNQVKSRLEYEKSKETKDMVKKWERAVKEEEKNLEEARENEKKEMKGIEEEMDKVDQLKNEKISKKTECDSMEDEITEEKRALSAVQKEITSAQKALMTIECRMDSKRSDRHAVLLSCKMECIELPLVSGNFDDIAGGGGGSANGTNGKGDDDDEDDEPSTQRSYKVDESIKPDYSSLSSRMKNVSGTQLLWLWLTNIEFNCSKQLDDPDAIKKKEQEMQAEINHKRDILRKIQAPNMRALDK